MADTYVMDIDVSFESSVITRICLVVTFVAYMVLIWYLLPRNSQNDVKKH